MSYYLITYDLNFNPSMVMADEHSAMRFETIAEATVYGIKLLEDDELGPEDEEYEYCGRLNVFICTFGYPPTIERIDRLGMDMDRISDERLRRDDPLLLLAKKIKEGTA
jgi:hypothetical protein